ncbi:hypothetical protein SAMN04488003_12032 [Loktanella fryxellensis]|uniref:Helicase/secretion neighborhood TadE-like protein n=1 Tax=Loktanella fryxellensis TaxID=245187 RepID=A0A1H8HBH8_9RHOB|nr:hypothetical protein [Loktanella fryxellensis]SEN53611.1 hypothetical protein SAMN04488003_12032 [Loktanella fryxellensis]
MQRMLTASRHSRLSLLFALLAALSVATGGVQRAQAAGDMIRAEMLMAPLLALGGTVADLCADGDGTAGHHADCVASCLTTVAAVAPGAMVAGPWWVLLRPVVAPRDVPAVVVTRAPPGPPVRAPPAGV